MAAMLWRHMVIKSDNDPGLVKSRDHNKPIKSVFSASFKQTGITGYKSQELIVTDLRLKVALF